MRENFWKQECHPTGCTVVTAAADRTQLVIDLVHGIDALEAERAELVAPLDAKIKKAREDLATLTSGRTPRLGRNPGAKRGPKRGVGMQLCELLVESPDASMGIRAAQIYGEDTPGNRAKLRCLFRTLKRGGYVRKREDGRWEVVPSNDN